MGFDITYYENTPCLFIHDYLVSVDIGIQHFWMCARRKFRKDKESDLFNLSIQRI